MVPRYLQWVAVAPKMGKRLGGFLSQPGLILGVDINCSGGREKRQGCVKELRNRIKSKISWGHVSKIRRLLIAGEVVVPTFQTSGLADLQGNENSRLLGATGRRGQPILKVNPLETSRNHQTHALLVGQCPLLLTPAAHLADKPDRSDVGAPSACSAGAVGAASPGARAWPSGAGSTPVGFEEVFG